MSGSSCNGNLACPSGDSDYYGDGIPFGYDLSDFDPSFSPPEIDGGKPDLP